MKDRKNSDSAVLYVRNFFSEYAPFMPLHFTFQEDDAFTNAMEVNSTYVGFDTAELDFELAK